MWIQVRSMDGKKPVRVDDLSKLTKIEDLRAKLANILDASVDRQRLFCKGKEMIDGQTLFDYNVSPNEVILILIKSLPQQEECSNESTKKDGRKSSVQIEEEQEQKQEVKDVQKDEECSSKCSNYKEGDILDVRDEEMGAWFEGNVQKVVESKTPSDPSENQDGFIYHVKFEGDDNEVIEVTSNHLRPRAGKKISFTEVEVGGKVMLNYNYDEPTKRGYWYDAEITDKKSSRTQKDIFATVFIGKDLVPFEKCKIMFVDELFRIESQGSQNNKNSEGTAAPLPIRETKPECDYCLDNPKKKCKQCSCCVCGDKKEPEKQIICDECNEAFHIYCLKPPLDEIPEEDDWYCPDCKLDTSKIVKAGEKVKESNKKKKMPSAQNTSNRDWGKGMACVGRSKVCTIVPPNHFGPIPGVEVGSLWKFRVQVSESGVHRAPVAGIHGRENEGAYSIVLSGGYEDDKDDGYEFTYTGSGGRDLSGNKRTSGQSHDQELTRMNRALAKNCDATINAKEGAKAKNWKDGKPVRVVRNCKGKKHNKFSPEDGCRYDGIYKVVKYWPEKGKAGFLVWKYLLRRDDPTPAPWTKEGMEKSKMLGLTMQYPDGWEENKKSSGSNKRKASDDDEEEEEEQDENAKGKKPKRRKVDQEKSTQKDKSKKVMEATLKYDPDEKVMDLIKEDSVNEKLWNESLQEAEKGKKAFIEKVENLFVCICCQDLVYQPITTECSHNFCKSCLTRSFSAGVKSCPMCRSELPGKLVVNACLNEVLLTLFPGYEAAR